MSKLNYRFEDGVLTIFFAGRIDAAVAPQIEDEATEILANEPHDNIVLDCTELSFLSSAGLRIVLRLAKKAKALKIVNVSPTVYEVLEMTGFTEMFEVSKALRRVSVEGCPVIGQGANGVVYRIDAETICKVYRHADNLPDINRERELSRTAFVAGIPTAIPYDVVRVGEGYGSIFELLDASSMAEMLISGERSIEEVAAQSAELLLQMAETEVDHANIPAIKDEGIEWVDSLEPELDAASFAKLRTLVSEIPDAPTMVHGDFHIKNIMVQNGEPLLIDMDTLSHGDPVFDLAATYNAYVGFGAVTPEKIDNFLGISHEESAHLWDLILHAYYQGADEETIRSMERRIRLVSSARLMSWPIRNADRLEPEAARKDIETYRALILEDLPHVDSLSARA